MSIHGEDNGTIRYNKRGNDRAETIIAGDRLIFKRTDLNADYANSAHTLKYSARLEGSGSTEIEITASASGDDYLIEVASATTANYTVGTYRWQMYITRNSDSQRLTLDSGTWEVVANRDAATTDPRSHARIMVEKIESVLEGRADGDVSSYSINGRSLTKLTIAELMEWRDRYKAEYLCEVRRERKTALRQAQWHCEVLDGFIRSIPSQETDKKRGYAGINNGRLFADFATMTRSSDAELKPALRYYATDAGSSHETTNMLGVIYNYSGQMSSARMGSASNAKLATRMARLTVPATSLLNALGKLGASAAFVRSTVGSVFRTRSD